MSVVDFRPPGRHARATQITSAQVLPHPTSIGEAAAGIVARIERERTAEHAMAEAYRDLEAVGAKLAALAKEHNREIQALAMMVVTLERLKAATR